MNFNLADIIEQIDAGWIEENRIFDINREIYGIKLYDSHCLSDDSHFIYVINDSDLPESSLKKLPSNLFIISKAYDANHKIYKDTLYGEHQKDKNILIFNSKVTASCLINKISDILAGNYELIKRPAALFDTIIKGRGLSYILQIAGDLLENPVLLGDANHRLLASSDFGEIDDASWMEFRNVGYSTYEYTKKYGYDYWIEESIEAGKPIIGALTKDSQYRRIFSVLKINGRVAGHLAVLEYNRDFKEKDLEITEFICSLLVSEMKTYNQGMNDLIAGRLLLDLLQEVKMTYEQIESRINDLKILLPSSMQMAGVSFNSYADTFSVISFIREQKNKINPITDIVMHQNHLVFLINELSDSEQKDYFNALEQVFKESQMECGVSQAFTDIHDALKHYKQSVTAIAVGRRLNLPKCIFYYENLSLVDLINKIDNSFDMDDYIHPSLLKLKEYDTLHKTDYFNSLLTYITHMGNIVSSAEALYIHRNTMTYRLTKIQDLINLDLSNKDILMQLFFSYKLLEYKALT